MHTHGPGPHPTDTPRASAARRCVAAVAALLLAVAAPPCLAAGQALQDEPIRPLPPPARLDADKVSLGKALFVDRRLSGNGKVSCMSCHDLGSNGAGTRSTEPALTGGFIRRNTPTVFNSALNFRHFWDGRAATQQALIDQVVRNPSEMAGSWPDIVAALGADAPLAARFRKSYGHGVRQESVIDALALYLRSLRTPNARIDRYLQGDAQALSADELRGYELFKDYGCVSCHQGANVGGNMFQVLGVMSSRGKYFEREGDADPDLGRYKVTKQASDRFVFRVPSLRNVATTAPYFHDGSVATLDEAVRVMFRYQLGRTPPGDDVALIVKFLGTLTGEHEGRAVRTPDQRP